MLNKVQEPAVISSRVHHQLLNKTGLLKVLSPQSKIKVTVVHAGLSQPLVVSKVSIKSPLKNSNHSHNNNSLIVLTSLVAKDAMVAGWIGLINTLPKKVLNLNQLTHTLLKPKDVNITLQVLSSRLPHAQMFKNMIQSHLLLPSLNNQPQLLLMLYQS